MSIISELEGFVVAVNAAEKERRISKTLKARMDFHSTPGTAIYNLTDGVVKISIHGIDEMRSLKNDIEKRLGES